MSDDGTPFEDDDYTYLAETDEVPAGERTVLTVDGREIAVFNVDGEYYGLSNYCVHQGGPICDGLVSGAVFERDGELVWSEERTYVSCPWHGWEFDIATGEHITDETYRLPSYEIVEADGALYAKL